MEPNDHRTSWPLLYLVQRKATEADCLSIVYQTRKGQRNHHRLIDRWAVNAHGGVRHCQGSSWATWRPTRQQVRPGSTWRCARDCRWRRRTGRRSGTGPGRWRGHTRPSDDVIRTRRDTRRWYDTRHTTVHHRHADQQRLMTMTARSTASPAAAAAAANNTPSTNRLQDSNAYPFLPEVPKCLQALRYSMPTAWPLLVFDGRALWRSGLAARVLWHCCIYYLSS